MQRTRRKMKPNTEPSVAPTITPALLAKGRNQGRRVSTDARLSDCTHVPVLVTDGKYDVVAYR